MHHLYLSQYWVFEYLDNYSKEVSLGDIYKQNQQENWSDKQQV